MSVKAEPKRRWLAATFVALLIGAACAARHGPASHGPASRVWRPAPMTTFQYQLTPMEQDVVDTSVDARVYSIDGLLNSSRIVRRLHSFGRHVFCYIDVGSWEAVRPDADRFPRVVIGRPYAGYPDERWLDIRRIDLLRPLIEARMDTCKRAGFDGVEPDNIDGFETNTGFPLTAADQISFNRFIAREAHARGLSVGLKNDVEQADVLVNEFDWALNEECFDQHECDQLRPFIRQHKAVFVVEYQLDRSKFCAQAKALGFTAIRKHQDAGAWREVC